MSEPDDLDQFIAEEVKDPKFAEAYQRAMERTAREATTPEVKGILRGTDRHRDAPRTDLQWMSIFASALTVVSLMFAAFGVLAIPFVGGAIGFWILRVCAWMVDDE